MIFGTKLLDMDDDVREQIILASQVLAEDIGSVTITEIEEYRSHILNNPTAHDHIAQIAEAYSRIKAKSRGRQIE